jgi:hypothetical protein
MIFLSKGTLSYVWLKKPANDYITNCQMWIATSRLDCRVPYQDKPTGSLEIEAPGSKALLESLLSGWFANNSFNRLHRAKGI